MSGVSVHIYRSGTRFALLLTKEMASMNVIQFDESFLFGAASSSTQIEGGDTGNTWYRWCSQPGRIADSSTCFRACDHWNRVEEDVKILSSLYIKTYRMSFEWSRIEPEPGVFSENAIQHYRDEIALLLKYGIRPLVTLHHFSEPLWFIDSGGWEKHENINLFLRYVEHIIDRFGDLVSDWVTFNEPNVYTVFGYILGIFPPGEKKPKKGIALIPALISAHCGAYQIIHRVRREKGFPGETKVGLAMHIRIFDGITPVGKATAGIVDYIFHRIFLSGFLKGRLLFPLKQKTAKMKKGNYADFLGINYYTRNIVEFVFDPTIYFYRFINDSLLNRSDLGWDIYPKGIYRACKRYYKKYRFPVYITENGISDKKDDRRPGFIMDHLAQIRKAIDEGIPVERYYHWSHMDNFEWNEGEQGYFGLYRCDFETQIRTPQYSAKLYAEICRKKEFSYGDCQF